jgi:hypothetical protein
VSWLGDAMRTIESVVLLRSKVEQLDRELARTNDDVRAIVGTMMQMSGRMIRLETLEEMRSGAKAPPRIEG